METPDAPILTHTRDGIMIITINRPQARNAINREAAELLEAALDAYEADNALRVAILTGSDTFFCSGQDLKEVATGAAVTKKRGIFGMMRIPPKKPIIAAVEGHVLAGGFELALSCDLIVASRKATFGLPEVKRALAAVGGGLFRLPKRIPYHLAMEMILTGNPQTAERMHAVGLVNHLMDPGHALQGAIELAETLMENAPLSLNASKEIAYRSVNEAWTDEDGWEKQMNIAGPVFQSEDFREGLMAFAQKRAPEWKGR